MAVEHTPPSTYILRELHDVAIPDSVSWAPQTIGWKILGVILLLVAIYLAYRLAQKWWNNRYRKEALQELMVLDARDKNSTERTFKVLKVVLRYLDSSNAKLFGKAYVNRLNAYLPVSANTSENSNAFFADEVSELWNWTSQISPISSAIIYAPTRKVVGANIGMKNTLSITEDQFATGADPRLVNHKTYYYMSLAYGFNEYAKFEEDTGTGQPRPYIEGRGNIKTYAYTPRPIVYQELLSNYGDVPSLTRLDGVGSGLTFIDMEDDMYDKILEASVNGNAADGVTYKKNAGPVNVKIYNPLDVKEGTFRLELFGTELDENNSTNFLGGDARWRLTNIDDGDVIESDTTIDVSAEQIVEKYGFSIELNQIAEPGELREVNNGAVGSTLEYDDVNGSLWMTAIPDGGLGNGDRLFDWVANTVAQDPENDLKEVSDVFYPFSMARYAPPSELEPSFYVTPAWKQGQGFLLDPVIQFGDLLLNQDLNLSLIHI